MASFILLITSFSMLLCPVAALGSTHRERLGKGSTHRERLGKPLIRRDASEQAVKQNFVYGTMFGAGSPVDFKLLQIQWNTFLKAAHAENRAFATTDATFRRDEAVLATLDPNLIRVDTRECSQESPYLRAYCAMCRRRTDLFVQAAKRNADWLVLHHVDMLWTQQMEEWIEKKFDPMQPHVLGGSIGCGFNLTSVTDVCPEMVKLGGLCGGNNYVFSRAAIAKLLSSGPEVLAAEYAVLADRPSPPPEDIADGCVARRHSLPVTLLPGKTVNTLDTSSFELQGQQQFAIFHPIKDPALMQDIADSRQMSWH